MSTERQLLEAAIAGLDTQRAHIGDAAVDVALAPLRARLAALAAAQRTASAGAEQTLRQVTVLFLDIVGSTTLSRQLDPEDIHAVIDGALASCTAIVEAHRGKVLQYAGDALLAVFGADEVREDDAERGVHAGLELLAEGRRQAERVKQRHGYAGFNVRVGLHTGDVLLGGGVDAQGSIRGMAVNIAARMEQSAPAGALRISHDTYRHVRGAFDVEPQPPILVKGLDAPIVTYLVQRARPRDFRVAARGVEGVETRMVGRSAELARLQEAFDSLFRTSRFTAITLVAHAGLGKSRLLHEFEAWAHSRRQPFHVFQGRAQVQTAHQPFGLLRDILARRFQIADSDTMPHARQKFEAGITPLFGQDDPPDITQGHSHVLGHMIGLDFHASRHVQPILSDGQQIRSRGLHAAGQMFRRMAAPGNGPAVVLLEDLHWADRGSLDFIDELGTLNRDVPLLVLATTRPDLFEYRPHWGLQSGAHQRIPLEPLDGPGSRALADALLQKLGEVPGELRDLVIGESEGNPFYMEEVVKMLVDAGAIRVDASPWQFDAQRLEGTRVPTTLTGVLQARLDRLTPRERLALQQAAVIGPVFWDRALAAIDVHATASLPALERRALIVAHDGSAFDGAREYAFGHHLLQQVAYDTLLKRTRRGMHARTAAWLAGLAGARVNDFLGLIAEHFEKADNRRSACEHYARAAENAASRYAHDVLLRHVERALALAEAGDLALRWRVLVLRERALDMQGRRDEQGADISRLRELATALGDAEKSAHAAWRHSDLLQRIGKHTDSLAAAREAMGLAAQADAPELLLRAQTQAARGLFRRGDRAAGIALARDGLEAARRQGFREMEGLFLNTLSVLAGLQGDFVAGLNCDSEHLQICREVGNRRDEANALINLGNSFLGFGEHKQARRFMEEGLQLARALGNRGAQSNVLFNLSILALREGDPESAQIPAVAGLDIALATQDPEAEYWCRFCLASAHLELRQLDESAASFERARALASASGSQWLLDAETGLARVALARDDIDAALKWLNEPLTLLAGGAELQGAESPMRVLLTCHQALERAGDPRGQELLCVAHARLQASAATIGDPALRESFLNGIPEHRAIVAACAAPPAAPHAGA